MWACCDQAGRLLHACQLVDGHAGQACLLLRKELGVSGYVHIPPTPHRCDLPEVKRPEAGVTDPPVGAVWWCSDCETFWRFDYTDWSWGPTWYRPFWRNLFRRYFRPPTDRVR